VSTENPSRSIDTHLLATQLSVLVLQYAESCQVEPTAVMHGTGLSSADLEDDDTWISYRQATQIIDNALRLTGNPALGLEVGAREELDAFGILGYAMLSSATLAEALEVGEKYQRTAQTLCDVKLEEGDGNIAIQAAPPFVLSTSQYRFGIEELFSGVISISRILTGEEVRPNEIHLAYAEPDYTEAYRQFFCCPVVFDSLENSMVLSRKVLELPITQANKFNARMSEKLCQEILHKYIGEEGLTTRIRHIILQVPGEFPDEEAVAAELALSARSLRRKLGELGTSYRDLREQVRSDLAQQYLRNSNMSVDQVAYLLGYTETTNFRRAFKRWLGVSPREYRNRPGG
jgi:AraC-like DNA-binding protein